MEVSINTPEQQQPDDLENDKTGLKSVLEVIRNYAIFLLYLDVVQDGLTRFLVFNFEARFFQVSHLDFTFRFISWAIYGFIIGNTIVIGKI